jgi:thiol-disulfide isomerase/thioredoxin
MYRLLVLFALIALVAGCGSEVKDLSGTWRGVVRMQNQDLPFTFTLTKDQAQYKAVIHNADENLTLDDVSLVDDTLVMVMHIFDAQIRAKISNDQLSGVFIKNYDLSATIPFVATKGYNYRFVAKEKANVDYTGKYSITFTNEKDTTLAVGIFTQNDNEVKGTFLTPTGDYRYLQGNVINDTLKLSAFDGNHTFLFTATLRGDTIVGDFYSGAAYHQLWRGVKTESASLPHPESLTYLKEGFDKIEFSFPDVAGDTLTPQDEKYKNKVVILQLFGTWCPNCMDETKFLAEWYAQNNKRGVEIIGLAYERKADFTYASDRVKKMKEKLNVTYDFVIAGVNDKVKAGETLPMLNKVVAFPTTIFIGKDGKVKYIHTGFSGPGTGIYYEQFKENFNQKVNELLARG